MKTAVILAAGAGTKAWPYAEIRPKAMIPIANKPVAAYLVEDLEELGFENIIIACANHFEQIKNYFRSDSRVKPVRVANPGGTAYTLNAVKDYIEEDSFITLYGDTIVDKADLKSLAQAAEDGNEEAAALVTPLGDEVMGEWIGCSVDEGYLKNIVGHPRRGCDHRFCGFAFKKTILPYMECNIGYFTNVNVGMMSPPEAFIEMSLVDYMKDGGKVLAVETSGFFIDIDKPWHILAASICMVNKLCGGLTANILAEGAQIDPSARITGYVKLGKNSRIGKDVLIKGSVIAGDNTIIENGAIITGNAVLGDNTYAGNYCQIEGGSTVGSRCIITHCAEFGGMIMDCVNLYHYMLFAGIIGTCSDLGAATVCGTLRFNDSVTPHKVKGRYEMPKYHSNSSYLGDFSRTGVNAIIMPGCKTGVYSIVGPGVVLNEDVPNNTLVMVDQQLSKKQWGPEKYGW